MREELWMVLLTLLTFLNIVMIGKLIVWWYNANENNTIFF